MKEIIVYFAGAVRGERVVGEAITTLIRFIEGLNIPVLSEHIGADDPVETLARKLGKTRETLTAVDICTQDIAWLDMATHVIVEISGASTGTGREFDYARTKGYLGKTPAQVLAIYDVQFDATATAMIKGIPPGTYPNVTVRSYNSLAEARRIVRDFLGV